MGQAILFSILFFFLLSAPEWALWLCDFATRLWFCFQKYNAESNPCQIET